MAAWKIRSIEYLPPIKEGVSLSNKITFHWALSSLNNDLRLFFDIFFAFSVSRDFISSCCRLFVCLSVGLSVYQSVYFPKNGDIAKYSGEIVFVIRNTYPYKSLAGFYLGHIKQQLIPQIRHTHSWCMSFSWIISTNQNPATD